MNSSAIPSDFSSNSFLTCVFRFLISLAQVVVITVDGYFLIGHLFDSYDPHHSNSQ